MDTNSLPIPIRIMESEGEIYELFCRYDKNDEKLTLNDAGVGMAISGMNKYRGRSFIPLAPMFNVQLTFSTLPFTVTGIEI